MIVRESWDAIGDDIFGVDNTVSIDPHRVIDCGAALGTS